MKVAYREVMLLRVAKANKRQLSQTRPIFEQGDKTGRLLAWISREQSLVFTKARLCRGDGTLVTDPIDINACFADFSSTLYSSRVCCTFGDGVSPPILSALARERLDALIMLEEVQQAQGSLQSGKIPEEDGFPSEFYKHYMEEVAPRLHALFTKTLKEAVLPLPMAQAIIVVIPKPGKDPQLCSLYRPSLA